MINGFQLIRNVGRFDSVFLHATTRLDRFTLIYAENGRGKTTLAAILRSLSTGDPVPIEERKRCGAQHPPHVIIACTGGASPAMFQNGVWDRTLGGVAIFDDIFVDQNVYSGLVVGIDHRQNLHELILGAQGVTLNQQLQAQIAQIEIHNRNLRQRANAIPAAELGGLTIDAFCGLAANPNVDQEIQMAQRNLEAVREQDPVRNTPGFDLLSLPSFDLGSIEQLLQTNIPDFDATAAIRVNEHLATIGRGAEEWIGEGMRRQDARGQHSAGECVFCAQPLTGSPVIAHYRAFFSDAYRQLQQNILQAVEAFSRVHNEHLPTNIEQAIRLLSERRLFWARFVDIPDFRIDVVAILRDWQAARNQIVALFAQKQSSPLDIVIIPEHVREAVRLHEANIQTIVAELNRQLSEANQAIAGIKREALTANPATIAADLARLRTVRFRQTQSTRALCDAYLAEKQAKARTEELRDQARTALDEYRTNIFPNYQAAINRYLNRFNVGFQIDNITASNTRSGPACTYNVVINNNAIAVAGGTPQPGEHSFKNTLSAGDRNTLALAFFFASLELDPDLALKTVVIDDPMSSLDDHRTLSTVQEIRRLIPRVTQLIVLSHSKPFLCRLWTGTDTSIRVALRVARDGDGSTIEPWNVDEDSITEHDRRDAAFREYLATRRRNEREIARSLRPHLEAFFRVAYPEHFPPGTLLGPFRGLCDQQVNTPSQILNQHDIRELRDIIEYVNRFHHDTNPAWETEEINEAELTGFVSRVLGFLKRQ